jgi:hypothetical protein
VNRLGGLHDDESGAFLLIGLAASLVLMLMAWVVMDAGSAARAKMEGQAAADTAAYSAAAVKARTMNDLVYANLAKRTVVGAHAVYPSLMAGYHEWIGQYEKMCEATNDPAICEIALRNRALFTVEQGADLQTFAANAKSYYGEDITALDNVQTYLLEIGPWWAWSEAVHRASRNGATMSATFPAPRGVPRAAGNVGGLTAQVMQAANSNSLSPYTGRIDRLPVRPGSYANMLEKMGPGTYWHDVERVQHEADHRSRSDEDAGREEVIELGRNYYPDAVLNLSPLHFGQRGVPLVMEPFFDEGEWLMRTSTLVLTYQARPEFFDGDRRKYRVPHHDYTAANPESTRIGGYWAMAKAEISFQGNGYPDMWHANWTGRMRPVALKGEWTGAGVQFGSAFHDILPHLELSAHLAGQHDAAQDNFQDLVSMERDARAMGQSTIRGVAK